MAENLIDARGVVVAYPAPRGTFSRGLPPKPVLQGVDITIGRGETVGIVGESGSGKTTLGRALLGLVAPSDGSISFDGQEIAGLDEAAMRPLRRRMQMIFQDSMSSLNPRRTDPPHLDRAAAAASTRRRPRQCRGAGAHGA